MSEPLYCSFCGRSRHEVRSMMPGPAAAICGPCIVLGVQMLADGPGSFRTIDGAALEDATQLEDTKCLLE